MDSTATVLAFVELVQKIYNQGELNPFIDLVQTSSRVVIYLSQHDNAHPSEISAELNMSRPNVTATLKGLEQSGYISRKLNPNNRREIYVSLTPAGRQYFQNKIMRIIGLFKDWIDLLGPEESQHLLHILELSSDMENVGQSFKSYNSDL